MPQDDIPLAAVPSSKTIRLTMEYYSVVEGEEEQILNKTQMNPGNNELSERNSKHGLSIV